MPNVGQNLGFESHLWYMHLFQISQQFANYETCYAKALLWQAIQQGGSTNLGNSRNPKKNKKFWEQLIAYFPLSYDRGLRENDTSNISYILTLYSKPRKNVRLAMIREDTQTHSKLIS
jgi:hypothetical protein